MSHLSSCDGVPIATWQATLPPARPAPPPLALYILRHSSTARPCSCAYVNNGS